MTSNDNRAPLLYYVKLCASFQIHRRIQTVDTVRKLSVGVKIILSIVTSKFDGWHWKTIGHLSYTLSSSVHHFKSWVNSNWNYSAETPNSCKKQRYIESALYYRGYPPPNNISFTLFNLLKWKREVFQYRCIIVPQGGRKDRLMKSKTFRNIFDTHSFIYR